MKPPALAVDLLSDHRVRRRQSVDNSNTQSQDQQNAATTATDSTAAMPVRTAHIVARIYDLKRAYAQLAQRLSTNTTSSEEDKDSNSSNSDSEGERLEEGERPRRKPRLEPSSSADSSVVDEVGKDERNREVAETLQALQSIVVDIQSGIRSKLGQCLRAEMIRDLQRDVDERSKAVQRMTAALEVARNLV